MQSDDRVPTHPGDILWFDFLDELGISPENLAVQLGVAAEEIVGLVRCERPMTWLIADLLAARFNTSASMWMRLQENRDAGKFGSVE